MEVIEYFLIYLWDNYKMAKMIKLILLSDVSDLGKKGDIISVKPGYGRNYLIPQKLAKVATDEEVKKLEEKQKEEKAKVETKLSEKKTLADQLAGITLELERKEGAKGKIFGSVDAKAIAKELSRKSNIDIEPKEVILSKSIKEVGEHKVAIQLAKNIKVNIKVVIKGKSAKK